MRQVNANDANMQLHFFWMDGGFQVSEGIS